MSQRLRVQNLLNSRIPALLNVCADDPRLYQWINSFQERALNLGRWWGSTQLVQFCLTTSGCLVLPREIAVIESANLGGVHLPMGNMWYQFVRPHAPCADYGSSTCDCCGCSDISAQDQGMQASFVTTTGVNKKIRVYRGNVADAAKKIIFQGKDANGVWVRTMIDGAMADGEQVTMSAPVVDTVTIWGPGAPYAVIKDETDYRVLVYSIDQTDLTTESLLADYQPSETEPSYRVLNLPGMCSSTSAACCEGRSFLAVTSLQHIPVRAANDWLLFQNISAYMDGVMAEKYYEEGGFQMGDAYMYGRQANSRNGRGVLRVVNQGGAIPTLQAELRKMTGDRTSINIQSSGVNLAGFM